MLLGKSYFHFSETIAMAIVIKKQNDFCYNF